MMPFFMGKNREQRLCRYRRLVRPGGQGFRLVAVTPADEDRAWEIFTGYEDQDFSFADCTSFAVMQRMKLTTAFAFDKHFKVMKVVVVPV
jgi:predicted nucleic acid-binding protein